MADPGLDVLLNGILAGTLKRKANGNLQFRYDKTYVKGGGMPLAFFGNLLPEEDVRAQVALTAGISAADDYHLLERFGGDVAGAVTLLRAEKYEEGPEPDALEVLSSADLDELLTRLPERPLAVDESGEIRLSLAGAQSKLPVVASEDGFALPLGSGHPTTHILKPEPSRFPGLVDNEFFCMRLAREVGLQTAQVERASTDSGLPFLIVTRYDRDLTQEPIRRLHQEDLCQALGRLYVEKYQAEGGPDVAEAIGLIDGASAVPALDRERFWLALAFNVLIGNCDAHGKNYSLLYDSPAPTLAPLYDLVSTTAFPELTQRLAMSVDGAKKLGEVNAESWSRSAEEAGVSRRFLEQRMAPFLGRVTEAAPALAERPEFAGLVAEKIAAAVVERAQRFA